MPKLTFLGHSAFLVESNDHKLIIDPFLTDNPKASMAAEDVEVDFVLLTHGHGDHFGDSIEIAKRNDATIIAPNELAIYCEGKGAKAHGMNTGGSFGFPFGRLKYTLAFHSSSLPDGTYAGQPGGILLKIDNKVLYHAGDTALFSDMKLIGQQYDLEVAILPIGDNFTMGVTDALIAAEYVQARHYLPMHFDTWPVIAADSQAFLDGLSSRGLRGSVLQPGESMEY